MNKFFDAAGIALAAIWASKLRSFMTVLGNIVAVTSIIAVVSLIQGLNSAVQDAILSQAGADSFSVQQFPISFSEEDFDRAAPIRASRRADADAIKRYGPLVDAVMLESRGSGHDHLSRQVDRQRRRSAASRRSSRNSRPSMPSAAG